MINFRFHVVAVTTLAVAIAGGVALGRAALDGPVSRPARDRATALDARNHALQLQVDQLSAALADQPDVARQLAPAVLAGKLTGASVLLVVAPEAASYVDGVVRMLAAAGAGSIGQVELSEGFLAAEHADELLALAGAVAPPSLAGGLPATSDGVLASSALLASVLVRPIVTVTDDDRRNVLAAYADRGWLTVPGGGISGPADAVVLLGGPATRGDAARRAAALYTVVGQFARTGPIVVSASGATGTVVADVRADRSLAVEVSTVDNLGTVTGQMVTAWALADQLSGHSGQYGDGPGAVALPALVP